MGLLNALFGRKKLTPKGTYFVLVDFSEEAKRTGTSKPKTLYHVKDGYVIHSQDYIDPSVEIRELRREGIFVLDKTYGQEISPESKFAPKEAELIGRLQTKLPVRGMEYIAKEVD